MREAMLVFHFLGMILAIGTISIFLLKGFATSKMNDEETVVFLPGLFRLNTLGHIGVTLSLISGGYLMTPYWGQLGAMPLLVAKLLLYVVLLFTMSMISVASRKARENSSGHSVNKIMVWTRVSFLLGLAVVILATLVFR